MHGDNPNQVEPDASTATTPTCWTATTLDGNNPNPVEPDATPVLDGNVSVGTADGAARTYTPRPTRLRARDDDPNPSAGRRPNQVERDGTTAPTCASRGPQPDRDDDPERGTTTPQPARDEDPNQVERDGTTTQPAQSVNPVGVVGCGPLSVNLVGVVGCRALSVNLIGVVGCGPLSVNLVGVVGCRDNPNP